MGGAALPELAELVGLVLRAPRGPEAGEVARQGPPVPVVRQVLPLREQRARAALRGL